MFSFVEHAHLLNGKVENIGKQCLAGQLLPDAAAATTSVAVVIKCKQCAVHKLIDILFGIIK